MNLNGISLAKNFELTIRTFFLNCTRTDLVVRLPWTSSASCSSFKPLIIRNAMTAASFARKDRVGKTSSSVVLRGCRNPKKITPELNSWASEAVLLSIKEIK